MVQKTIDNGIIYINYILHLMLALCVPSILLVCTVLTDDAAKEKIH